MLKGPNSSYLRLHRIPTAPSKYILWIQFFCLLLGVIAVLMTVLDWWLKLFILLILIGYLAFLKRGFQLEQALAEGRYLLLNDKDEWLLSEQDVAPQKLKLQSHVLILPFIILLPFRAEKRVYTFIYCRDNLEDELGRILRVRLLHPVISKHPLKKKS